MLPAVATPNRTGAVKAAPVNAWSVPRDAWRGEAVFIVGGGPSILGCDLTLLRGRRVFAINTSWRAVLDAGVVPELVMFGDVDWWGWESRALLAAYAGLIVTAADVAHPRVQRLRNCRPDRTGADPRRMPLRLSEDPAAVPLRRATFAPAMNVAWLGGARAIVTLGLDGKAAPDGRTHHHKPHPKPVVQGCWDVQAACDLAPLVADLKARGCTVLNASPESVHGFATVTTLAEAIAHVDAFTVTA